MAAAQISDIESHDEIPNQTRSDSISTTGSDVTNETFDDAGSSDEIRVEPFLRVSSPGPNGSEVTHIGGASLGPNVDNVNLNISVKVNDTNLKSKKVKDEPGLKEQTVDAAPHLGVKAVAKEESDSKKDGHYTIDLQFMINMDRKKKGKRRKERKRPQKSETDKQKDGDEDNDERGSDDNDYDLDLDEGAVGGNLSDVIPEEPEGQSGAGTPRDQGMAGDGDLNLPSSSAKKAGTGYLSGYDSGYFDYGKKQATDIEEQDGEVRQPTVQISGSQEDEGHVEEQENEQLDTSDKFKKKSKSHIRKERAKRLKDRFSQPPRLVLRRRSAAEMSPLGLQSQGQGQGQGQGQDKPCRRYSITGAKEELCLGSSDEDAFDDANADKIDTLIVLNKLGNFLRKNMPGLKQNEAKLEQSSRPVQIDGMVNYVGDLDNAIQVNLPKNVPGGHDLDTSFTTEEGEHSGEVTPRNASDTENDDGIQEEALTPRNSSPSLERRSGSPLEQPDQLGSMADWSNKQTAERKSRLTRQSAREDYFTTNDHLGARSPTNTTPEENMRPHRLAERRGQYNTVPSIEVSNEDDETVEVVKPKSQETPKSPKMQRAKSESAVSQGLLAPYCKIDMGNSSDSDEVFTLSAHRSPHFTGRHGSVRTETLKMDSSGRTRAEIVLDCDNPEALTAEELGIKLGEGEELRFVPVLVLDAQSTDAEETDDNKPEFPHSFAPIGIIPLSDEKENLTEQELGQITEKAEEILKDTERGKVFQPVSVPNFQVKKPKAPSTGVKVFRRSATESSPAPTATMEEPALPVTLRNKSQLANRRALSECGSPRGSPRIVKRELYKEFFEPTRRITRPENEVCSPIEKTHHEVIENLNQIQFDKQVSGEDISTSGLGGYQKDLRFQRRNSRDSIASDSSEGSKEEQGPVFVFPPSTMSVKSNLRTDSDREDSTSVSSGSGISTGTGESIRQRRKSLEEKFKQDQMGPSKQLRLTRSMNFSNVRDNLQRKLSDGDSSVPVLDGNRTKRTSDPKLAAFERPQEYAGVRNKFEKLIANDRIQSPTLARPPKTGAHMLSVTKGSQISRTVDDKLDTEKKKPEQSWTWKQRELQRSKSESTPSNPTSNSRPTSCPTAADSDDWFMPSFDQKTKEKERPRSRDVSPFRDEDTDWFFSEIKPEAANQEKSGRTLAVPGSADARQKRQQWSDTVQQERGQTEAKEDTRFGTKPKTSAIGRNKSESKSLNSNNNARKSQDEKEHDLLFLQKTDSPKTHSSPIQFRKHERSKTSEEPSYGLTVQAQGKYGRSSSYHGDEYGLTIQTTGRPRTVSQGSEADDVFLDYSGTQQSLSLKMSSSQEGSSQNPFMEYRPVGRHQPIVIDGRTQPPQASASPRMSRTLSEGQKSKPISTRGQNSQHSPRPQMSRSSPSQSSMSGLAVRAMANRARNSPQSSHDSSQDCQRGNVSMTSVDSGWFSDRLDSTMSDVFDLNEGDGYTSDTTETPRPGLGRHFFPLYNSEAADDASARETMDSAINQLLDENDGYSSDDELFRQRCIDVFKTLHHEDVVYQQFQKLLRFRQRRISLHKDNFKIIPKKDDRSESDSDGNVAYLV